VLGLQGTVDVCFHNLGHDLSFVGLCFGRTVLGAVSAMLM
jgi:hypothetical protein